MKAWLAVYFIVVSSGSVSGVDQLSFNRDVRPILSDLCFRCHGPDAEERAANLRFDVAESALADAVVPGDADDSEMILRIQSSDPDLQMPPPETGKTVTPEQLQTLRRWIDSGAEYEPHWAYVAPRKTSLHDSSGGAENSEAKSGVTVTSGTIDRVLRWSQQRSLVIQTPIRPAKRAGRRVQLRRLYLDLTGLPPNYESIQAFEKDDSPGAYDRRVDALLASPAFGERLAEYWLDLVRFADTVGYHGDQDHNITPYRDYVIDAINDGMPLDQFSIEQIAGDLLDDASIEQKIASGYNRLLQTSHEGGVQPKEYLAIYSADRVRNFSAVWMAATVGCAQCHDHKYDPYTARDFYSMAAFFADIDEAQHFRSGTNSLPTRRSPEIEVLDRTDRMRLAEVEASLTLALASDDRQRLARLEAEKQRINGRKRKTMISKSIESRTIRFLPRGNWLDETGDVMEPAIPSFLGDLRESLGIEGDQRLTRLHLARWLFDVDNGIGRLTARVFANRLWYLYTGRGISPSLGDFGGQGQPPTHPELLDHLANVLVENDWDIKATVRVIVTSEVYRRAVVADANLRAVDPYNELCLSQSGHRLPAETVRDSALEIAGLLDHRVGGRSAKPYQPSGYYRHLNFPTRKYKPDSGVMQWRRGLYTHWQRQFLHPMLKALDAPSREECTAQRSRSNTPVEALVLLNDPTFVVAAQGFAARLLRETVSATSDVDRVHHAMRIAVGRDAEDGEAAALLELLNLERERYASSGASADRFLEQAGAIVAWPESFSVDERAAWSSVTRAILNLHETLYRP
ncbi:MAG: PSD1 and planctomycete cytochrome C domain-containing protein [Planctomycetota bacterium]